MARITQGYSRAAPRTDYADAPAEVVARARALDAVCQSHGVNLPAAALQFILANPLVVSVIPGGQNVNETRHKRERAG